MLNRTRAKDLIPKTAKELDLPVEMVKDVIDFYYVQLRAMMEEMEHSRITVPGLGVFKLNPVKLKKSIEILTKMLESDKPENFSKIIKSNLTEETKRFQQEVLDRVLLEKKELIERYEHLGKKKRNFGGNKE